MSFPALTQAQFIAIWKTLFPSSYTYAIETQADGQGLDYVAVQAAIFARVDEAANETFGRLYIRQHSTQTSDPASGAARAAVILTISRNAPAANPITLAAGVEFVATLRAPTGNTIQGVRFRVIADTLLASGALTVAVPVEAVRIGFESNVIAGSIADFAERGTAKIVSAQIVAANTIQDRAGAFGGDRLTPAMVGQYVVLTGGANGGTQPRSILSVTQATSTTSTATAILDGPALTFPDTLARADVIEFATLGLFVSQTMDAEGGLDGWLDALGDERLLPRQAGETDDAYRIRITTLADVVSPGAIMRAASRILSPLGIPWRLLETRDPAGLRGFVWDIDPYDVYDECSGIVYLDALELVRFFSLAVGPGDQGEFGMFYDTFTHPTVGAWDVGFYDGAPTLYNAAIAQLWAALNSKRAAGIGFEIIRCADL